MRQLIFFVVTLLFVGTAVGQEEIRYSRSGADTCLNCHEDQKALAIFKTVHAVPSDDRGPFGQGQLQCEACHGPGGYHAGRVRRGEERPPVITFRETDVESIIRQNAMCLDCHESGVGSSFHDGAHGTDEVSCAGCHSSHAPSDPVLQTVSQPEVCYDCHIEQRSQSLKAFSHPLFEGKMDCSACHSVHGDSVASELARETVNDTCQQCHAETRGPYLWEHAPVSEDCGLCHEPHGSNHIGMLTRRAPLLCQSCHSQAGHPSIALGTEGLASEVPSRYLLGQSCMNCHSQVHGSNHPSGSKLMR